MAKIHLLKRSLILCFLLSLCTPVLSTLPPAEPLTTAHSHLHVVILGDSNTWIGGDDCDKPEGWNKWFREAFQPASCKSYARSGATWTHTVTTKQNMQEDIAVLGDDNVIYNQVCRLIAACDEGSQPLPDLIVIAAGTNDAWFVKKRPQAFSLSADEIFASASRLTSEPARHILSLAGAVRYDCELLQERFPQARIILLTPLQTTRASEENMELATNVIESCGRLMGLPVIRQDKECCVRRADEARQLKYTRDGAHTTVEGARINGLYLARRIAQLIDISRP